MDNSDWLAIVSDDHQAGERFGGVVKYEDKKGESATSKIAILITSPIKNVKMSEKSAFSWHTHVMDGDEILYITLSVDSDGSN